MEPKSRPLAPITLSLSTLSLTLKQVESSKITMASCHSLRAVVLISNAVAVSEMDVPLFHFLFFVTLRRPVSVPLVT
ncbi:hypothetical protein ARMSODRAFT_947896, partial [Armillaria solidipes]